MAPDLLEYGHKMARRCANTPGRGRHPHLEEGADVAKYGPKPRPPEERFWPKVDKTETCWLWTANRTRGGYGLFQLAPRKPVYAHRWAYEALVGPIPKGLTIDHLCRVRHCVRPDHMEPVTSAENTRRGGPHRRKPYCRKGHPRDEVPRQRTCPICKRESERRRKVLAFRDQRQLVPSANGDRP